MKPLEPQITIRAVAPVVAGLEALGHDVEAILADAPIRPALLENADGHLFIGPEEANLCAAFGSDWSSYTTRVRRWI